MTPTVITRASDCDKHTFDVTNLLFHKGNLYSASDDGKVKVWAPDLRKISEIQAHPCTVYCLAASDDTLFTCSNDGTVKSWDLVTLKEKATIMTDTTSEFWSLKWVDDILYVGDDQGNVRIFKKGKFYGLINVAEPVKDMALEKNLLFTGKDQDIVVTDLHLGGEKIQFGMKDTLQGRAPIVVKGGKVVLVSKDGKNIILYERVNNKFIEGNSAKNASELVINALCGTEDNGNVKIFSGGWDKVLKQWKIDGSGLKLEESCNVDLIINALTPGEKGQLYAAGGDGHIVCVQL